MIIAVDGMGGDHAPGEIIAGALKSLAEFDDIHIHIYGDEQAMAPYLKGTCPSKSHSLYGEN